MSITLTEAPSKRSFGRQPRLSQEDVKDLAESIKAGFKALSEGKKPHWATDNEPVKTRSAAYQRAQSARDLVIEFDNSYTVEHIKTSAEPVDINDLSKGYIWKIGPRPQGEKPRSGPTKKATTKSSTKGSTAKSGTS